MIANEFIAFAHLLADASAEVLNKHFGSELAIENKADNSPVSAADFEAEKIMREMIAQNFPEHGVYGEEFGTTITQQQRYSWVLDPIDGTRAFLAGKKEWGTLIALCDGEQPILGVLNQPATHERWLGVQGAPTLYNGNPVRSRKCASLAEAEISTTSALHFTPPQAAQFVEIAQQCRRVVRDGDCYAYGLLARGERDIVIDSGLKAYDILALVPIIEGAGGRITAWDNTPISLNNYATACARGDANLTVF